jgi:hypothetical protein
MRYTDIRFRLFWFAWPPAGFRSLQIAHGLPDHELPDHELPDHESPDQSLDKPGTPLPEFVNRLPRKTRKSKEKSPPLGISAPTVPETAEIPKRKIHAACVFRLRHTRVPHP